MQDFLQALQLDPDNAELTKLLTTAREKHREVEGISAAVEEEEDDDAEDVEVREVSAPAAMRGTGSVAEALLVEHKHGVEGLQLPPAGAALLKVGSLSVVAPPASASASLEQYQSSSSSSGTFVRINVVSDDEDEEESEESEGEEGEEPSESAVSTSFNRIAITEEEESDEEEDREETSSRATEEKAAELKEQGNKLLKQGDAAGAVDAYTQSLGLLPTYLPSLNNRAQAYLALKVCECIIYLDCLCSCAFSYSRFFVSRPISCGARQHFRSEAGTEQCESIVPQSRRS